MGESDTATTELFEGRDTDLDCVFGAVLDGTPRSVVLVRGEAGIGKTVLLRRVVAETTARGWRTIHVQSDELDRRVPYAAFARAVSADPDDVADDLGAALLEALDVAERTSVAAVHGAALRFLSALRDVAPVLIAVDDIPLLDDATTALVAALLRRDERHPLVVVGTVRRSSEDRSDAFDALLDRATREERLRWIDLGPVDGDAVASIATSVLGVAPDPALHALLVDQSGGNPFFVTQLLLDLDERGRVTVERGMARLQEATPSLDADRRTAVLNRVLRAGDDARALARALALLGPAPLDHLTVAAELAGMPVDVASAAFDRLVDRGILRRDEHAYRFAHDLVRDALHDEVGPAERWRWHQLAAQRLQQSDRLATSDEEVARHVREVAPSGDDDAIDLLTRVAERSSTSAPHAAIPWFRDALAITPDDHARRPELLARLSRTLFLAGRSREAADAGRDALRALPGGRERDRLAIVVIEALVKVSALDDAVAAVEAERPHGTRPRLAAKAAHVYALAGRPADTDAAADLAMAGLDDATAYERLAMLVDLVQTACVAGFQTLPQLLKELRTLAAEAPPTFALNAYATMSYALAMQGDTRACAEATTRAQQLLTESGWGLYRAELAVAQARNLERTGEWDTALDLIADVAGELEAAGSWGFLRVLLWIRGAIHANRGEWAAARSRPDADVAGHRSYDALDATLEAEILLLSGDLDRARALVRRYLDGPAVPNQARGTLVAQLAEIELERGEPDAALAALDTVASLPAGQLDVGATVRCQLALGRAKEDPAVLAAAVRSADEHRLRLLAGRGRLYLGIIGDEPARDLTAAIRTFHTLGATPWRRRAAAELRHRELPVPRHRPAPSTFLTETEAQIARLIQLGRPNREIAAAVSLSVKTVEGYLSKIYAKTGCSSRLELARALDDGLLA